MKGDPSGRRDTDVKGDPGGRRDTGDHGVFEQRLAVFEQQVNDLAKVASRLENIAAIDSDVRERAPERAPPTVPHVSAQLTRQNLRLRVSVGVLGIGSLVLAVGGVNVFSYARGLSQGDEARTQVMVEAKAVREQLDDHEARIADTVRVQAAASQQAAIEIRRYGELHLLQSHYMTEVLEAIRRKKEIPRKPQILLDAESRAFTSVRDAK